LINLTSHQFKFTCTGDYLDTDVRGSPRLWEETYLTFHLAAHVLQFAGAIGVGAVTNLVFVEEEDADVGGVGHEELSSVACCSLEKEVMRRIQSGDGLERWVGHQEKWVGH
jgi:hypothetical protein